jgi:hypothetical protein
MIRWSSICLVDHNLLNIASEALPLLRLRRCEIRNLFGHWAARRIPNQDAVVLLSKDENDAMRTGGAYLSSGHVKSCVLDLADIRGLIVHELNKFEPWLALKIAEWRKRYVGD